MANFWVILIAVATFSWAPVVSGTTVENSIQWRLERNLIEAIHSRGRRQIMGANISSICRQTALTALSKAAVADSSMNCTTPKDIAEDLGDVVLSVWDSIGNLMTDINTVVNAIPMCMADYSTYNIFGKISCLFTNFKPIWYAVKDFWNFRDFWMDPYNEIMAFVNCLEHKKSITTSYVNKIVKNARSCS